MKHFTIESDGCIISGWHCYNPGVTDSKKENNEKEEEKEND